MKFKVIFIALLIITGCAKKKKEVIVSNFKLEVYDFNGFEKYLNKKDDKVYVVNFWAT